MGKEKDNFKEPTSIIEEIEEQLGDALSKKKDEIEKELEERIKREKEEAKKRIEDIEKEFAEEREALKSYRDTIKEYENDKSKLRDQIKEHLDTAIQYQSDIESLTAKTLEELKALGELNKKLEDLHKEAEEKASVLKKNLEDRFGIVAEVIKTNEVSAVDIDLERELSKLKKIKELLTSPAEALEEEAEELKEEAEEAEEQKEVAEEVEEVAGEVEEAAEEEEAREEEVLEEKEEEVAAPEGEVEPQAEEAEKKEEPPSKEELEQVELGGEPTFQGAFETLEEFRKTESTEDNGEISYFVKDDKIVMDGECLVSALGNNLDEAKKLYIKLHQTESPKDQFFIKQEIIRHQESLRKVVLRSVSMCEKENCSFPSYTADILNMDVLKDILEKLNMENWSNEDDFTFFEKYAKNLKTNFYSRITPPAIYLKSIIDELKIG
jgi:chromosome segregation ATPase